MNREDRLQKLVEHHRQTLWIYWSLIILGVWTILAPFLLGYSSNVSVPSGGREIWLPMEMRSVALTWSDVISGSLLIFFGWRTLKPNRPISLWICCLIGVWLSFAPLLFWAPNAVSYLNDSLVGLLVIALTVLIPGMPNMVMFMQHGGDTPPGWSYNPSSWPQRAIMAALGFLGWVTSRYLAAFQLGHIEWIWEPFFDEGSVRVLNSDMSHLWPVSDAGLGAFSYTFEFLMAWMGAPSRWRTMPWMVTFFGILVVPLGLTHIILVISQPVVVGSWCTICLLAAAIMLPMIPLTLDEVVAMIQYMIRQTKSGAPFWRTFWLGGGSEDAQHDHRTPPMIDFPEKPLLVYRSSLWGMSTPWSLILASLLGLWLMVAPSVLASRGFVADTFHLAGAFAITISVVAFAEVVRPLRWLLIPLGLWCAIAPLMTEPASQLDLWTGILTGFAFIGLSIPKGSIHESYGSWDDYVR